MHKRHKLNIDSNRHTINIKIAVENANLCGKICDMHTSLKCAKMRQYAKYAQSHIRVKLTCLFSG